MNRSNAILDAAGLEAAVAEGIIDRAQADRLTAFAAQRASRWAAAPQRIDPDDEPFRLVTSFNDIFVTMAILLVVGAASFLLVAPVMIGALMIVAAWGFSEIFVLQRRMALPAIVLAIMNAVGAAFLAHAAGSTAASWIGQAAIAATSAVAAILHFRRYRVPIDFMLAFVGIAGVVLTLIGPRLFALGGSPAGLITLLAIGLCGLAVAVWFDLQDPRRETLKADIAFWMHLASAPAIVHGVRSLVPIFTGGKADIGSSNPVMWAVILVFLLFALVIDRRALIVSSLFYIIGGMVYVFSQIPGLKNSAALGTLAVGALLIGLSVGWPGLRRAVVDLLPLGRLRGAIPPVR